MLTLYQVIFWHFLMDIASIIKVDSKLSSLATVFYSLFVLLGREIWLSPFFTVLIVLRRSKGRERPERLFFLSGLYWCELGTEV